MARSLIATFSEPEDFATALRSEGYRSLMITERGRFWARLTQIALHHLRVSAGEERLSRIAFIEAPADMVLISLPIGNETLPIWGGIGMQAGEIMTLSPGQQVHVRTDGCGRWSAIWLPAADLVDYGGALIGTPFGVPPGARRWRGSSTAGRHLRSLHAAALRMTAIRPQVLVDAETVHGLEQQLIEAVVECMVAGPLGGSTRTSHRHQEIMVGFERLLQRQSDRKMLMTETCAGLGISERLLRSLCAKHLGMSPTGYDRLRRMSLVDRTLRRSSHDAAKVSEVAERYGFRNPVQFAAYYKAMFGDLPSATSPRDPQAGRATDE
jgi:AraC-like DNA-binding protein